MFKHFEQGIDVCTNLSGTKGQKKNLENLKGREHILVLLVSVVFGIGIRGVAEVEKILPDGCVIKVIKLYIRSKKEKRYKSYLGVCLFSRI